MIGKTLGHYEILAPLGEGGMGQVYRARDTTLDRDVAIKVLPEDFASDANRLARFEREAKLLASLNHPNIATIFGFEESDGVRFIAMELVEGQSLAEHINATGRIQVDMALEIARRIALALEAAHEAGVIHRDLKPANVQVAPEGTVKVLDFGIAKVHEQEASADLSHSPTAMLPTATGVIMGTAHYMSPEQARGKALDKRTDIWSFGCVLYEMLAGRTVFAGETITDVLAAILDREPDWTALPETTSPIIRLLLRQCLRKDPGQRLHDIADARVAIVDAIADPDGDIRLPAGSTTGTAAAPASWRTPQTWITAAALLVAATVVTVTAFSGFSSERATRPAVTRFALNLPEGRGGFNSGAGVAVSPDGSTVVYSASEGVRRLYRRDMDVLESVPIRGTEGGWRPFFSPDGVT